LPTDRVSFEKQMALLRAFAAASTPARELVTTNQVGRVIPSLAVSSVLLCSSFMCDVNLLTREGSKLRPSSAVFDYLQAWEWNPETAAAKLAPVLQDTWFARTLLPKLAFRQLSRDEAVSFLAEEAKASTEYKKHLDVLIEYLHAAGVIRVDGNTIFKGMAAIAKPQEDPVRALDQHSPEEIQPPAPVAQQPARAQAQQLGETEQFSIPIPGKDPAVITVPKNLDADDWTMLSSMIDFYIARMRKDVLPKLTREDKKEGP
jgi:hypothetical protein